MVFTLLTPTPFCVLCEGVLSLDNNNLAGSIPTEIGTMVNLEQLRLAGNSFNGGLPSNLGLLKRLGE